MKQFGLGRCWIPPWSGSADLLADELVPTIEWDCHGRSILQMAKFGFRMPKAPAPITSIDSETIDPKKPSRPFLEGRCIVPVDIFSQRKTMTDGNDTIASYGSKDESVLGLAGLLRPETGGVSVTILTKITWPTSYEQQRMPAILNAEDYITWLDDTSKLDDVFGVLAHAHETEIVPRIF